LVKSGDHLVIVSDMLAGEDRFDSVQLRVVP
jgi:pyruvate kinase